jgi:putative nucleotidyltransferase with HDIG domain
VAEIRSRNERGCDRITTPMRDKSCILLISDRRDRNQRLADTLTRLQSCQTVGLLDGEFAAEAACAVVLDVGLSVPTNVDRLRQLVTKSRTSSAPVIALLREDTHLERVQAAALGATIQLSVGGSLFDVFNAVAPIIQSAMPAEDLSAAENLERAGRDLRTIFTGAASGAGVGREVVGHATSAVIAAITRGGIRQWLEIVWTYDDATFQHCMLVTGVAAEFAARLGFSVADQNRVVTAGLLHDVGKSKIPLAILNKPTALTNDEQIVMRTHPQVGYELLHTQGEYESDVLEVVLRHHEFLDGSGYPDGFAGVQVTDMVRLVTICDIYAALIERRPYKQPIAPPAAFKVLQDMEGKLEGPLVRAFAGVAYGATAREFA